MAAAVRMTLPQALTASMTSLGPRGCGARTGGAGGAGGVMVSRSSTPSWCAAGQLRPTVGSFGVYPAISADPSRFSGAGPAGVDGTDAAAAGAAGGDGLLDEPLGGQAGVGRRHAPGQLGGD